MHKFWSSLVNKDGSVRSSIPPVVFEVLYLSQEFVVLVNKLDLVDYFISRTSDSWRHVLNLLILELEGIL